MRIGLPAKRKTRASKLSEARLRAARAHTHWTELEAVDLVARPGGLLVATSDDAIYMRHPGVVWETGSAAMIADMAPLYFYEDGGYLTFLERLPGTWSERLAEKERRRT
jgi:hypothetical protein